MDWQFCIHNRHILLLHIDFWVFVFVYVSAFLFLYKISHIHFVYITFDLLLDYIRYVFSDMTEYNTQTLEWYHDNDVLFYSPTALKCNATKW